jgi:hypothetical protein
MKTNQVSQQNRPWHSYPLVWMMIAIPFSAVIMGVVMIWLAVGTEDGLVVDDYYKQGLAINEDISRDKRAAELGLNANIEFDNSTRIIHLKFDKGIIESYPEKLHLHIQHATREDSDILVVLDHGIGDQYIGHSSEKISDGIWYFELAEADWKLNARSYVRTENFIQLNSDQR